MAEKKSAKSSNHSLSRFIIISLFAGIIFGWIYPEVCGWLPGGAAAAEFINGTLKTGAHLFLKMIKMILAPLVFATLVVGIAGHGSLKNLGNVGKNTIIYFLAATSIALIIGLLTANILQPGKGCDVECSEGQMRIVQQMQAENASHSPSETVLHMVPKSVFHAMADNDILQIVVFSIFFAVALAAIGQKGEPILEGLRSLSDVMFKFTEYVMYFAPLGVFTAIAATVGQNGIEILYYYGKLIFSLYLALAIFVVSVLVTVCAMIKVPFLNLVKAIKDPAILAFSTATSEAALPKAMETMEKFGVPKKIVGFVMPTGYTFNLDGSTLYLSLAAIFIAQMYNIELSIGTQIMMMLTLMLSSKGMAGIPRVSLIILAGTLGSFNIPIAGVAVLLGIDHILDMGRTTVNLIGNCVATVVVARWENEFDYEKMNEFIEGRNAQKAPIPEDPVAREFREHINREIEFIKYSAQPD